VVGLFLYLRGWRLSNLGAPFKASDPIVMVGLMLATYVVTGLFWQAAVVIEPTLGSESANELMGGKLSLGNVVLLSVVNPIFEEALLCGYIVTALKERRGFWFAVNVSVALRVANHLYQGSMGVLSILPLGLLFTVWYARTNRLWPVILAHAAFDLIALWPHIGTVE
jgi:membrane protease YdiL (CAAX protease family)